MLCVRISRGILPPEIFLKLGSLKWHFPHSDSTFSQNFKTYFYFIVFKEDFAEIGLCFSNKSFIVCCLRNIVIKTWTVSPFELISMPRKHQKHIIAVRESIMEAAK